MSEKRLSRVPRYVGICAFVWSLYAFYFCVTGRGWSMGLCLTEAVFAIFLVVLSDSAPRSRLFVANLNLAVILAGITWEGAVSGGLLSCSPVFLASLGILAAHQLGIRAGLLWSFVGIAGVIFAFCSEWAAQAPIYRVPTHVDKIVMFSGLVLALYTLSRQAERSYEEQVTQLTYFADGLQEKARLLRLAEQTANVGHWHFDTESGLLFTSRESRKIVGIEERQEYVSIDEFTSRLSRETKKRFQRAIEEAVELQESFNIDLEFFDEDGSTRFVTCNGFSEQREDGQQDIFGVLKDETESYQHEKELFRAATLDALTELPNRHKFQLYMSETLKYADETKSSVATLVLDLNGFKEINDTLGHSFGDRVLQVLGKRLVEVAGSDFVARMGGDEFVIVQRDVVSPLEVSMLGGKISRCIAQPIQIDGRQLNVSASVGAAVYPRDAKDRDELLAFADTAMYRSKKTGERVRLYEAAMTTDLVRRHEMENQLATALQNKEFYLVYQPQVRMIDQQLLGFEALIRWNRNGEIISPFYFIPLLEQTGRIVDVGRWVLQEACRQTSLWVENGYDVDISVNISPIQFRETSFVPNVWEALEQSGLAANRLDLELTESVIAENVDMIASKLDLIKTTGSKISIDDFGTGYSSLAYLQHFPIDRLKIDRAFVKDFPGSDDGTIARSIVTMADSLGMVALAEGVETQVQLDFLREQGCEQYQGYLYSKPLSVEDAESLMSDLQSPSAVRELGSVSS